MVKSSKRLNVRFDELDLEVQVWEKPVAHNKMSLSIEGERIRGASATPKRCLDEWLLYSLGLFLLATGHKRARIAVSHREASSRARARDATLGPV